MIKEFDEDAINHELFVHLLWSTKNQQAILAPIAQSLYSYMCDLALSYECNVIDGHVFNDHIQLVVKYTPDIAFGNLLTNIKVGTSLWIRTNFPELRNFEWQQSDFAFSVSWEEACSTIDKINAKIFSKEVCRLLNHNDLTYDPQDILE